jgi:predicted transcriptional regulator
MPLGDDLIAVIPIGEENAVTSLLLSKHLGVWSNTSIKRKLNELAAAGLVERKRVLMNARPIQFKSALEMRFLAMWVP